MIFTNENFIEKQDESNLTPTDIIERKKREAEGLWENGKPKKWYYAFPIILFWTILILLILKMLL